MIVFFLAVVVPGNPSSALLDSCSNKIPAIIGVEHVDLMPPFTNSQILSSNLTIDASQLATPVFGAGHQLREFPAVYLTDAVLPTATVLHALSKIKEFSAANWEPCVGQRSQFASKRCLTLPVAGDQVLEAAVSTIGQTYNIDVSALKADGLPIIRYLPGAPAVGVHGDKGVDGVVPNATLVLYLTDGGGDIGGRTFFPSSQIEVSPKHGSCLSFANGDVSTHHGVEALSANAPSDRMVVQIPLLLQSSTGIYDGVAYSEHVSGNKSNFTFFLLPCLNRTQSTCQLFPLESDFFNSEVHLCAYYNDKCQDARIDVYPIPGISYSHGVVRTSTAAYDFVEPDMILLYRLYEPEENASSLDFGITGDGTLHSFPKVIPFLYCAKTRKKQALFVESEFTQIQFFDDKILVEMDQGSHEFTNLCMESALKRSVLNWFSQSLDGFSNPFYRGRTTFTRRLLDTFEYKSTAYDNPKGFNFGKLTELKCFVPRQDNSFSFPNSIPEIVDTPATVVATQDNPNFPLKFIPVEPAADTFGFVYNSTTGDLHIKYAGSNTTSVFRPNVTNDAFQHAKLECFCDTDYTCGSQLTLPDDDGNGNRTKLQNFYTFDVSDFGTESNAYVNAGTAYAKSSGPNVFAGTTTGKDLVTAYDFRRESYGIEKSYHHIYCLGLDEDTCSSAGCSFEIIYDINMCLSVPVSSGTCHGTLIKYADGFDFCAERPHKKASKSSSSSSKRSDGTMVVVGVAAAVAVALLVLLIFKGGNSPTSSRSMKYVQLDTTAF